MWYNKDEICEVKKLNGPSQDGGLFDIQGSHSLGEMALKGILNAGIYGAKKAGAKAIKSDYAKRKIKDMSSKYIDQVLDSVTSDISRKIDPGKIGSGIDYDMRMYAGNRIYDPTNPLYQRGSAIDIQKHLSKLGELHMRTPTGKKYNYCGPGTKLEERLASNEPKYRDPINNLDSICQKHDIDYSKAKTLSDKHKADGLMLKRISEIPYMERPWGTTAVQAMIKGKKTLGLGVKKSKNGKGRRVGKTGRKN